MAALVPTLLVNLLKNDYRLLRVNFFCVTKFQISFPIPYSIFPWSDVMSQELEWPIINIESWHNQFLSRTVFKLLVHIQIGCASASHHTVWIKICAHLYQIRVQIFTNFWIMNRIKSALNGSCLYYVSVSSVIFVEKKEWRFINPLTEIFCSFKPRKVPSPL